MRLFTRYPLLMAILSGFVTLLFLYFGLQRFKSTYNLSSTAELLSVTEIGKRISAGNTGIYGELTDGRLICSSMVIMETTYNFIITENTTYVLIANDDNSIILYTRYSGKHTCNEILSKPIIGIITPIDNISKFGMYQSKLMNIQNYPNAMFVDFCIGCTKQSVNSEMFLLFGLCGFSFLSFLFSLFLQWKKWEAEESQKSLM